jgi:uncharacterized Zn-finger protein
MNETITGNHIEFDFDANVQTVCPHCQSGFVIISIGVSKGLITMAAICTPEGAKRSIYCPYCGKDMTEIFNC